MAAVRVKICCIASPDEARTAIAAGADAVGLVSAMPSGPGPIPDDRIREVVAAVGSRVETFLLTCQTDPESIADQLRASGASVAQLVDRPLPGAHRRLREALPGVGLVQVIHVRGEEAIAEAIEVAPEVDALLLDSGDPGAPVPELGGTGRVHDWEVSRRLVEAVGKPVWLAGGLGPGNVGEAIRRVRPFGVDLCSGVRTGGRLDSDKLRAYMAEVRGASADPGGKR